MAIGGTFNSFGTTGSSNENASSEFNYYSRLKVRSDAQNLSLSYEFWKGNLVFKLSEYNGGFNELERIHISPTKAMLLDKEIDRYIAYTQSDKKIDPNQAFGISTGMGDKQSFVAFRNVDGNTTITIGKFDNEGNITSVHSIPLNNGDYNFSLHWDNIENNDLVKVANDNIELTQVHNLVKDFARAMSGAYAYATADLARYDNFRSLNRIDSICEKLGIERRFSGNSNYGKENSFLSNAKMSSTTDYDSIEAAFEDD